MLSININEILVTTSDIGDMIDRSIYNFLQENELGEWDDHFSLDRIDVFKRKDNFVIIFVGMHGENLACFKDFKFHFTVPHNFNMNKVVRRFWNKIITEAKLESKGFKKVEVAYDNWL